MGRDKSYVVIKNKKKDEPTKQITKLPNQTILWFLFHSDQEFSKREDTISTNEFSHLNYINHKLLKH